MATDLYIASGAALVVGGLVGWWLKGARYRTERLILEEHYMRKVRLAETDREKAIRQLNQNQVEMRSWEGRIESHQAEAERLEKELRASRNQLSALRKDTSQHAEVVAELESRIEDRGGRIEELLKSLAEREAHAAAALRMETEAVGNLERACALLDQRGGELEELAYRLQEAHLETRRVGAELSERVRASDEKRTAIETDWERNEQAIRAAWEERHAQALAARETEKAELERARQEEKQELERARREEKEALERARREEKQELTQRLAALEPLPARVAELQARLEEARSGHENYAEARREEIGKLEAEVATRDELVVELDRERRAHEADREEAALTLAKSREDAAGVLEKTRARAARELETTVARAEKELERMRAEAAQRLEAVEVETERKLEKEQARAEKAEARVQGLRERVAARDEELADQKKHLAALSNSHKAAQLKVDRLSKRVEDLSAALSDRRDKLNELREAHRDRGVELKSLSKELKTAGARNARAPKTKKGRPRDELQEIAGIGPAMETKLRRLGFGSYEKLAVLDREGVERLAERVGTSPQRIRRERWVSAAKREFKAKYGRSI